MTKRLYYDDSYLTEFSAKVVEERRIAGRPAVILDATAFYPTSGGQPHDTGTLGGQRVVEAIEDDSGAVLHVLDTAPEPGVVQGRLDWQRRFDHMQQHTGQHMLSQAFLRVAGAATLSFHLGTDTSTIDLDLPQPTRDAMVRAEQMATQIAFEDRPVQVLTVGRNDLAALGVRKESRRQGEIRVIDIEGFDRSPCGGTHVRRTGEIGIISILGFERYKGGTRVEFVCGGRVLACLRADHDNLQQLARLLSAHPQDLIRLLEKLLGERAELSRENTRLRTQLLDVEARELLASTPGSGSARIVIREFADRGFDAVKLLAQRICNDPNAVAILSVTQGSAQVVVARGSAVRADCGAVVRQVAAKMGGRGGGRPELAQAGGVAPESLPVWLDELKRLMSPPGSDPQG